MEFLSGVNLLRHHFKSNQNVENYLILMKWNEWNVISQLCTFGWRPRVSYYALNITLEMRIEFSLYDKPVYSESTFFLGIIFYFFKDITGYSFAVLTFSGIFGAIATGVYCDKTKQFSSALKTLYVMVAMGKITFSIVSLKWDRLFGAWAVDEMK